jgi:hypothetical protein
MRPIVPQRCDSVRIVLDEGDMVESGALKTERLPPCTCTNFQR